MEGVKEFSLLTKTSNGDWTGIPAPEVKGYECVWTTVIEKDFEDYEVWHYEKIETEIEVDA